MKGVKAKAADAASSAKEKMKEWTAKTEEKTEKAAATTKGQKAAAHERAKAKEAAAEMEKHEEKAAHRTAAEAHVPLTHVPGTRRHHVAAAVPPHPTVPGEKYY
ncbi:uncharacterized protein LOC144708619 [Wolffia australiana]